MAFVNISLLLGGLLAAIPIILHLVLRQQPKRISFPALRFLKERRESNRRELQLRHWILLLLRCAAVGLLALALARPSVASSAVGNWLLLGLLGGILVVVVLLAALSSLQGRGKWFVGGFSGLAALLTVGATVLLANTLGGGSPSVLGDQQAPVAAVLVFDTSPRMEYRFHNQTRLAIAKETGLWLLGQFPPESSVAVMESRAAPPFFAVDLAAAKSSVERLRVIGIPEPLPESLTRALGLVKSSDKSRKEVYVFTDLSQAAWKVEHAAMLRAALEADPGVLFYVVDVGVDQPRNASLRSVELSNETLVSSSDLTLHVDIQSQHAAGDYTVELVVEQPDPSRPVVLDGKTMLPVAIVRDRKTVTLPETGSQRVDFRLRGWELGTQQGSLRLLNEDGLDSDNTRFFAAEVRNAFSVLLVAPDNVSTFLLNEALAPLEERETGAARFDCHSLRQADLPNRDLGNHAVICLVDPQPLLPAQWEELARYVHRGGGLLVMLGHNAKGTAFNDPAAQRLLGAKLAQQQPWRAPGRDVFLAPRNFDHPALAEFRGMATSVPWSDSPVFYHWSLAERAADLSTVIEFSNGQPALLERPFGAGRIVVMTTPIAEESRPQGRSPWNEMLTSEDSWPSFTLLNEWMKYLATGKESRLNYVCGETATLANDPSVHPLRYQLFTPLDEPQDVVPRDGWLVIPFTENVGAYRLKGQRGGPVIRGFAVNLPADASDLTRLTRERLDDMLGADRYRYARNRDEIVLEVGEARVGREFYPYLLLVLVVVLGLEHTLANRFYRKSMGERPA